MNFFKKTKKFEADFLLKLLFIIIHWSKLLYFILVDISVDMRQHLSPWATLEQVNISVIHQFLASFVYLYMCSRLFLHFRITISFRSGGRIDFITTKTAQNVQELLIHLWERLLNSDFEEGVSDIPSKQNIILFFGAKWVLIRWVNKRIFFFKYIVKLSIKKNPFDGNAIWHYNEI